MLTNSQADDLAEVAYETYRKSVGGKSFTGDNLPHWKDTKVLSSGVRAIPDNIRQAWRDAVTAVVENFERPSP